MSLGFALAAFAGCTKKVADSPREVEKAESEPGVAPGSSPALPPPQVATAEQRASSVLVHAVCGNHPAANFTGALLRRDQLDDSGSFFEQNRCVIALFTGWTESQLRSGDATFTVFRNLPNAVGEAESIGYPARLADFDAQTGLATLTYFQGFSANLDVGYSINREPEREGAVHCLRLIMPAGAFPPLAAPANSSPKIQGGPPLTLETRLYSTSVEVGSGQGSNAAADGDDSLLLAGAPAVLDGFLRLANGGVATPVSVQLG
jgi:hypothetical protein